MKRRIAIAAVASVLVGSIAIGLRSMPWHSKIDLWLVKESPPGHVGVLTSVWWNEDGTRAIVVGRSGTILERNNQIGDIASATWSQLGGASHEDLYAIAGGNGPWRYSIGEHARVFGVGAHGRIIDCTYSPCKELERAVERDLRGISVAGGQALVVGDYGTVLQIAPDPHTTGPPELEAVVVQQQSVDSALQNFTAVWLACSPREYSQVCDAVVVGAAGAVFEGFGKGYCDNGERRSGTSNLHCEWTWSRSVSPTPEDLVAVWSEDGIVVASTRSGQRIRRDAQGRWSFGELVRDTWKVIRAPVRTTETRLWSRRESSAPSTLAFGERTTARLSGAWIALPGAPRIVAGATPELLKGEVALLVADDGEVFLAR